MKELWKTLHCEHFFVLQHLDDSCPNPLLSNMGKGRWGEVGGEKEWLDCIKKMAQSEGFTVANTVERMKQFQAQRMDIIANTPCVLAEVASSE